MALSQDGAIFFIEYFIIFLKFLQYENVLSNLENTVAKKINSSA